MNKTYDINKQLMLKIANLQDQIDQLESLVHYYKVGDNQKHNY